VRPIATRQRRRRTAAWITRDGAPPRVVVADVARPEACESLVAESVEALGGLDGLVLNVGIGAGRGVAGTSVDEWDGCST
jgi:NAD(P)-dependent dehydrogenase (short-subunit alcohol dehydrogenase family)